MRISDWSSDVCSSDLFTARRRLFLSPADRCKGFALTLYARFAAHLDAVRDTLETEGVLPADLPRKAVAVEPRRDPQADYAASDRHRSVEQRSVADRAFGEDDGLALGEPANGRA